MLDYIIVGQGIAGTMLSWFLLKENQRVVVIDEASPHGSSVIAAGVINPVTGRKFVKTWLAGELLPFAESTYAQMEHLLGERLYQQLPIIHLFDSVKAQNDWSVRCASEGYKEFLANEQLVQLEPHKVKNPFAAFEINGGGRVNAPRLLGLYRAYLQKQGNLLNQRFEFSRLQINDSDVTYDGYKARRIIFCDGGFALHNPYFKFFPFQPAKGECLLLHIPGFYNGYIIKAEAMLMPWYQKDIYYAGATHNWYFDDDQPSEIGKNEILGNVAAMLNTPYAVTTHFSAIRPTVKDRRPFVGLHPKFAAVGIFNGMGTKGFSLAPYFAHHFVQHLLHQKPLMREVDIQRFLS